MQRKFLLNDEAGNEIDASLKEGICAFVQKMVQDQILIEENILNEQKGNVVMMFQNGYMPDGQLFAVTFELTYRCNEKCRHCYCGTQDPRPELSKAEILQILDDLYDMNVFELTFTGGDLFVRRDTFEILQYARKKGFLINVFTNGIALKDADIFRLKELNLKSLHFSIYSSIPERHDLFTQVKGSFEKTTSVIKKCVLIGIPVNIKTCVINFNEEEIEDILLLAKSLGTTIQLSLSISPKNDGDKSPTQFRVNNIERYAEIMRRVNRHIVIHCSNDLSDVRYDTRICGAGSRSLSINPYGDVYPCNALLLKCGNVRETSICDIWEKSEQLKKIREFSTDKIKGCENCPDLIYCNYCPGNALTETGDPLQRYDEACFLTEAKRLCEKLEKEEK